MSMRNAIIILVVFVMGAGAGFLSYAAVVAKDGKEGPVYTIDNCVAELSEERIEKTEKGWKFWFVPTDLSKGRLVFKMTEVAAHSENHGPHVHDVKEEIIFVFEGKVEFSLNGKTKTVGPNSSLYCPPGVPHGIRNVGDTPIRYAIIQATCPAAEKSNSAS